MYVFYLGRLRLPIAPPKMTMKIKGQNKTVNLIDGSEINILKQAGLTEITFEARFPPYKYYFASFPKGYQPISTCLEYLEHLKQMRRGFQLIIYRNVGKNLVIAEDKSFFTNITVSMESYSIVENAEDGLDCVVSITLKQYQKYGTKEVVFKTAKKKQTQTSVKKKVTVKKSRPASTTKTEKKKYTVKSGDCLWNLARQFYGDPTKYTVIYNSNKQIIEDTAKKYGRASSSNGWCIYPRTVLDIPSV